jgi:hypothetical protein
VYLLLLLSHAQERLQTGSAQLNVYRVYSSTLMGLGLESGMLFFFLQNVKAFPGWSFLSKFSFLPHVTGNRSSGNVNAACGPSRTRKILLAANGNNQKKSASKRTAADDFIPISNLRTY